MEKFTEYTIDERAKIARKCAKNGREPPWVYYARRQKEEGMLEEDVVVAPTLTLQLALRKGRTDLNISQKQLAQQLNVKPALIAAWETGKEKPFGKHRSNLVRILKVKLPKM